jgi:hypothetical protein
MMITKQLFKIIASISFILLSISLYLAHNSPTAGYELSIYAATPILVWFSLIAAMLGGFIVVIYQVTSREYQKSKFWLVGLLIILLSLLSLLYVPCIRGYVWWLGDQTSLLGLVKDITSTSHIPGSNFYPVYHLLIAQSSLITSFSEIKLEMLYSGLPVLVYFISIYLLSRYVLPEKGSWLLSCGLLVGIPVFLATTPFFFSTLWIPLIFYFSFKSGSPGYMTLFIILLVFYPFFHVLSSLLLIAILAVVILATIAYRFILHKEGINIRFYIGSSIAALIVEAIILIQWILQFSWLYKNIKLLWSQIISSTRPDVVGGMKGTLDKIDVAGLEFIKLLFTIYGPQLVFSVLSVVAGFILIKQIRAKKINSHTVHVFILLIVFLFLGLLYSLYLLGVPGLAAIQPTRIIFFLTLFSPILAGFCFINSIDKTRFRLLASIIIILIVTVTSVLATFSFYDSPIRKRPGNQLTQRNINGTAWLIDNKITDIGCIDIMTPIGRLATGLLGSLEAGKRADLDRGSYNSEIVPDHFSYNNRSILGEIYVENKYLVITTKDRILYTELWSMIGRFTYTDFDLLENDISVDRVYSNGDQNNYYVHAKPPSSLISQ